MPILKKKVHNDLVSILREERIKNGIEGGETQDQRM